MKAKLTGMGSYQGNPTADSSITITYSERLEDGAGNASVSQYVGKLDTGSRSWRDAHTGGDLLLPVTLSNTVRVEVTEVFRYTTRAEVRTTFTGWATPTNMDGTELDYTQMRPPRAPSGAEPLTMQAARDLLARGNTQLQQTAQATAELRSVAGVRSLGRAPQAGDPAGLYRWVDGTGHEVDSAWDGNAETGRTGALLSVGDVGNLVPSMAAFQGATSTPAAPGGGPLVLRVNGPDFVSIQRQEASWRGLTPALLIGDSQSVITFASEGILFVKLAFFQIAGWRLASASWSATDLTNSRPLRLFRNGASDVCAIEISGPGQHELFIDVETFWTR